MLGILTLTEKSDIKAALQVAPKQILKKLQHFVGYYTRETKVFNGPPPNPRTVAVVRELLSRGCEAREGNGK